MAKTTAAAVADYILAYAAERGVAVTHLKLQKLLYFCYGCYLARAGEELFAEPLEAWPKGPVEPGQWRRFAGFGSTPISAVEGAIAMAEGVRLDVHDDTLDNYLRLNPWLLVQLSHGMAWAAARGGIDPNGRCNIRLDRALIAAEFEDMLKEREAVTDDPEDWPLDVEDADDFDLTFSPDDLATLERRLAGVERSGLRRFNRAEMERRLSLPAKGAA